MRTRRWAPHPTPRNMSMAILLRLLSLSSMRDSWSGVCEGRKGHIRMAGGAKCRKGPLETWKLCVPGSREGMGPGLGTLVKHSMSSRVLDSRPSLAFSRMQSLQ